MNKTLLICISFSIVFFTCCREKETFSPKLDENQFIKMVVDIHLADGALATKNIFRSSRIYKPSYYYNSIYQKYQVTPEQFDSCIFFYSQNTERFTKMYEKVIDSLNRLETKYRIELKNENQAQDTINLWKKKTTWKIPEQGKHKFDFAIPVNQDGIYTIKASIKIFKDDQTVSPQMEAYFWKEDTVDSPQTVHFDSIPILTDAQFKDYILQLEYPDTTYTELRGNLFADDNEFQQFNQHFEIKGIMIFNPRIRPDTIEITEEEEDKMPYPQ